MLEIPFPSTSTEWLFALMGMQFAAAFSNIDYDIQQTKWFTKLSMAEQKTVKSVLDFFHHWWIGAILYFYPLLEFTLPGTQIIFSTAAYVNFIKWFGAGIFIDDSKDLENLYRRYFDKEVKIDVLKITHVDPE